MLTNEIIKSMEVFRDLSTEGIKEKMLECGVLSKNFPVKGVLPMELIENQLHDVYEYVHKTIISVIEIIKKDGCEDDKAKASKLMTAKNAIMNGMKIIANYHDLMLYGSICEAYIEANKPDSNEIIIPTYEECLKVYESKFMNYMEDFMTQAE